MYTHTKTSSQDEALDTLESQRELDRNEYGVAVGDCIQHVKDDSWTGRVTHLDRNLPQITTCKVHWNGYLEDDIQWTNKLLRI